MTFTGKIIKIGNSEGVTIPSIILKNLEVKKGELVEIKVKKIPHKNEIIFYEQISFSSIAFAASLSQEQFFWQKLHPMNSWK